MKLKLTTAATSVYEMRSRIPDVLQTAALGGDLILDQILRHREMGESDKVMYLAVTFEAKLP